VSSIFLPHLLTGKFVQLTRAPDEDVRAKLAVAIFFTMLLFLAPLGAMLKSEQFWERINEQNKKDQVTKNVRFFIFSPWFSFIWLLIIYAFVVVSWMEVLMRDSYLSSPWVILAIFFGGMIYCFIAAVFISNFFRDYNDPPRWKLHDRAGLYADDIFDWFYAAVCYPFGEFLETRLAAVLGDLCIYLNMILFQIFWGYMFSSLYDVEHKSWQDLFVNFLLYLLLLCLFYFPARNFYLAEDIHRPIAWLTIFLANLPSFLYFSFRVQLF